MKKKEPKKVTAEVVSSKEKPSASLDTFEKGVARTDSLQQYINEIKKYPLLSKEEEKELTLDFYKTGDPNIAHKLITSNLRFVVKVAFEYAKFGGRIIDLIQEGNMGLIHAVQKYNPHENAQLITYAVWWIRGYIQKYLLENYSIVKAGTSQKQKKLFYELQKAKEKIDQLGYQPVIQQISGSTNIPIEEVDEAAQRLIQGNLSLDQPFSEDEQGTFLDAQKSDEALPDQNFIEKELIGKLKDSLKELKKDLNKNEIFLLEKRILSDKPLTLAEIGEKRGVTREAVRQMEGRLIKKIKQKFLHQSSS